MRGTLPELYNCTGSEVLRRVIVELSNLGLPNVEIQTQLRLGPDTRSQIPGLPDLLVGATESHLQFRRAVEYLRSRSLNG